MQNLNEGRKIITEKTQHTSSTRGKGRKVGTAEHIPSTSTKSRSGRTVKPSAKAQEVLAQQNHLFRKEQSSEIEKTKTLSLTKQSLEIEKTLSSVEQSSEIEKQKTLSPVEQSSEIEKQRCFSLIKQS